MAPKFLVNVCLVCDPLELLTYFCRPSLWGWAEQLYFGCFSLGCVVLSSQYGTLFEDEPVDILLILIPPSLVLLTINSVHAAILGFLIFGKVVILRQSEVMNLRYWERLETEFQLKLKTRDLQHAITEAQQASAVKLIF